jgi:hypothetical protein
MKKFGLEYSNDTQLAPILSLGVTCHLWLLTSLIRTLAALASN